ncbi:schwannomin-interacting protein 1 [Paralichthys olivaceus]|uniref:schwannomin-interacting protein 1 n=1 Tax=Paralichthys olivaceus TaxID=8255 RepID=UPI0037501694
MEGEKETAEEKEEEEEEEKKPEKKEEKNLHPHVAAASSVDYQDLPIIHWEDLTQRIAELEKQEQERRERSKRGTGVRMEQSQGGVWRDVWEEEEGDLRRCRVAVVTSRFLNHRNLQLCFINSSDSEDEDEGSNKKVAMGTERNGCHSAGLKQEVATALRTLRDELLAEQKKKEHLAGSSSVARWKHLERWELQECSVQQLSSSRASLQQEVHALSSELVAHLLVRDQLRTKQDAMLLDVQDLT